MVSANVKTFLILVVALTIIAPFVGAQETKQSPIGMQPTAPSMLRAPRLM